jgi:hypothetical protein
MQDIWEPHLLRWDEPVPAAEVAAWRAASREMFGHAYGSYLRHGFPADDVRPLSCTPSNSQARPHHFVCQRCSALLPGHPHSWPVQCRVALLLAGGHAGTIDMRRTAASGESAGRACRAAWR